MTHVDDEKRKAIESKRESGWVGNFQKYTSLDPVQDQKRASENSSRLKGAKASYKSEPQPTFSSSGPSHRCDAEVPSNELIMLGLYRLNDKQQKVYADFVNMLKDFDSFDVVRSFARRFFFYLNISLKVSYFVCRKI